RPQPTAGRHSVQIAAYTDRGNSNATPIRQIFGSSTMVPPSKSFSVDVSGSLARISLPQVTTFKTPDIETRGIVEFLVPPSAATQQASIFFSGKTIGHIQVFAFRAGPTNVERILALPRDLVGTINSAVETNSIYHEFDIT